jgi:hypothetical protein
MNYVYHYLAGGINRSQCTIGNSVEGVWVRKWWGLSLFEGPHAGIAKCGRFRRMCFREWSLIKVAGSHMIVKIAVKSSVIVAYIWKEVNLWPCHDRWRPQFYLDDCDVNYTRMLYVLTVSFQDGGKLQRSTPLVAFYTRSATQRLFEWQVLVRAQK